MSESRLVSVAPELVREIERQKPAALRAIALSVSEWVIREVGVVDERLDRGIAALEGTTEISPSLRSDINVLWDGLDVKAWDIQDLIEGGEATEGEYEAAFFRARAANALWYALDPELLMGTLECVYEAQAATDIDAIRRIVYAVIETMNAS
ncbi:MAG TPA: hypothetical protein VHZ81_13745 [Galbitalea sp.]|nr:hypothetical protein [Galbitalea sp.]